MENREAKKNYSKPELLKHGDIKVITKGDCGPKSGDYGFGCS